MAEKLDFHLVKVIADIAIFCEYSDDSTIDPDSAVALMERLASELQLMDETKQLAFVATLGDVAANYKGDKADFINGLGAALGLA
jgi:hypothetical protein